MIDFIDPESGSPPGEHPFDTGTATADISCGGEIGGNRASPTALRREFDADYLRLAVSIGVVNGGHDVGYVSSGGGLVDVIGVPTGNSDFATAASNDLPSFRPGTSELWFQQGDVVASVDTAHSAAPIERHPQVKFDGQTGVDASGRYHLPAGVPVDASGTRWVNATENPYVIQVWKPGDVLDENFSQGTPVATYSMPAASFDCNPTAWISLSSWLCEGGVVATVGPKRVLTITDPIPATDGRSNFDAVLSPDHTKEAFQSCRGGICSIYVVPLAGGTPVKVMDNPDALSSTLVEWR